MCIIAWHWEPNSDIPLIVLANRDEFYERPALPMHWWEHPAILAGKDLQSHGTWLAFNQKGHFAGITNYRNIHLTKQYTRSRGEIIPQFFKLNQPVNFYIKQVRANLYQYQNFNLILFDGNYFTGFESVNNNVILFQPGTHVVSNGFFNCTWPKSIQLKESLIEIIRLKKTNLNDLNNILQNKSTYSIDLLPKTGLNESMEEILSSIFIQSNQYGTRASSVFIKFKTHSIVCEITYNNINMTLKSIYKIKNF